jgi:DNA-binding NarL/FixJ family response regulator
MPEPGPGNALLIVDNSLFIIDRLLSILKEAKAVDKIYTATNYNSAVTILGESKMDIVLLDIGLPDKNGIELLKHIVHHFTETKVIILSNLVSSYYQKLCTDSGAACFIDKSKEFDRIPEVIFSVLNGHTNQQEK